MLSLKLVPVVMISLTVLVHTAKNSAKKEVLNKDARDQTINEWTTLDRDALVQLANAYGVENGGSWQH